MACLLHKLLEQEDFDEVKFLIVWKSKQLYGLVKI